MEVSGAMDIVVVLGEGCGKRDLFRQLIAVAFQDGFEPVESFTIGQSASAMQALGRVGTAEIEQSEAEPVSLFGMGFGLKTCSNPDQHIGTDIFDPVF